MLLEIIVSTNTFGNNNIYYKLEKAEAIPYIIKDINVFFNCSLDIITYYSLFAPRIL